MTSAMRTAYWAYLDSYFGGTDFLGQEVVWHAGRASLGHELLRPHSPPERIDAATAGRVIKQALSALYREGPLSRRVRYSPSACMSTSTGRKASVGSFSGHEVIEMDREAVYRLDYHGGLIRA